MTYGPPLYTILRQGYANIHMIIPLPSHYYIPFIYKMVSHPIPVHFQWMNNLFPLKQWWIFP